MAHESTPLPVVNLPYSIAGCSEHSGRYVAENIMVNSPQDQSSRWSGAYQTTNAKQWLLLRLDSPAVIKSITFGKFHKPHPCNMKEFKLYVGLWEDNMTEVLHAGLKNDPFHETFAIRSMNEAGLTFPTQYLKIEPLTAHGHSFHTSIWYVQLNGVNDQYYMDEVQSKHEAFCERTINRLILKHLRQRRMIGPFQEILARTSMQLEHPAVSSFYSALVLEGNFSRCEELLRTMADLSLFSASRLSSQPYSKWTCLVAAGTNGDAPSARGGHAMCIDPQLGKIYLFGGWDGQKNMDDLWVFDTKSEQWKMLSSDTQPESMSPGPRACHKMAFDSATGDIYLLGRLNDSTSLLETGDGPHASGTTAPTVSPVSPLNSRSSPAAGTSSTTSSVSSSLACGSELYCYHTRGHDAGKWELVIHETATVGGPPLVFDHQMLIDSEARMLYVYGGRVVDGDWESVKYSGLYSYDIQSSTWKVLQVSEADDVSEQSRMAPRYGHSMVFDHLNQTIFVFGGQRDEKYLSDMYAYHIPTNTTTELYQNYTVAGGPDAGFTQRAVIDAELQEIYIFSGLTRRRPGPVTLLDNETPYWIYRYDRPERPGKWVKMVPVESSAPPEIPVARWAHQVVYNPVTKVTYMHGGNARLEGELEGDVEMPPQDAAPGPDARLDESVATTETIEEVDDNKSTRLDDFWKMSLIRPSPDDIIRQARFVLRQQQFRELCEDSTPIRALAYLQTEVSAVVDHSDPEEAGVFRALLAHLLAPPASKKRPREDPAVDEFEPEDDPMTASSSPTRPNPPLSGISGTDIASRSTLASSTKDPAELSSAAGGTISDARFQQRTGIFERLMTFVNEDARQPDKDLMRMINVDQSEVQMHYKT